MTTMGLPLFLAAYACGLLLAPWLSPAPWFAALPFLAAVPLLLGHMGKMAPVAILAFFFLLGIPLYHLHMAPPRGSDHIRAFVGESRIGLEGKVLGIAERPMGRLLFDLEAQRVVSQGIAAPARGKVRLYVDKGECAAKAGDTISVLTRLRAPRPFGTPGEFDFPRHLASAGIFVTAHAADASEMAVLAAPGNVGLFSWVERARQQLGRRIDRAVDPAFSPLVRALVTGDKSGISSEKRDLMARGGVSHLFAISGLHLGLLAAFLYAFGLFFYRRSDRLLLLGPPGRYLPLFIVPFLLGYLALTGNALPTRRAFLMALVAALLLFFARRTAPLGLLTAVAFFTLVLEPLALYHPAFQLSFAGVFGILVLVPRWMGTLEGAPRPLRTIAALLFSTAAATTATTPLVLLNFHMLAPAGLLTNLAAVPAIGFLAVPAGLAGAFFVPCWPTAGDLLFRLCASVIDAVLAAVDRVVRIPLLTDWKLYPTPAMLLGVFLITLAILVFGRSRKRLKMGIALLGCAALLLSLPRFPAPALSVTAISVGQGDSILLSRGDRHFLVDGGGLHGDFFDVGERLVAPALGRLGIRALDAVILTHDHPDHRKGLVHILEHFPVTAFWSAVPQEDLHPSLLGALARKQIPVVCFGTGWTVLDRSGENMLALFVPGLEGALNDRSLVLYCRQGRDGVLLTGDLEAEGVGALLRSPPDGPVTLLKLPHHGSRHSLPERLLDRFEPQQVFVSAGLGNSYDLPNREVTEEVFRRSLPLHRTDRQGTLRFVSDGEGWRATHWDRGLFR